MLDPAQFQALTFDCYGTLIDWETGILRAVRAWLNGRAAPSDTQILETYADLEQRAEAGPYRSYRMILSEVAEGLSRRFGVPLSPTDHGYLAESVADWSAFPDTAPALD